jgi:hypothetical protein
MGFILLTYKYLKQFAMKELRDIQYTDSLVRVRVKLRVDRNYYQLVALVKLFFGTLKEHHHERSLNPILHTPWLNNHALTLKRNTAKYYFGEKSSVLHTFLSICCEASKIKVKLKEFFYSML